MLGFRVGIMARQVTPIVLLLFVGQLVLAEAISYPVHHSVYFLKENEYYITQSKWLAHFVVDLQIYKHAVNQMSEQALVLRRMLARLDTTNRHHAPNEGLQTRNSKYIIAETNRISVLQTHIKHVAAQLDELNLITPSTRTKRSWFPFVGNVLEHIFGTATSGQLNEVQDKLHELAKGQEDLNHIIEDSLTIINITRIEANQNRQLLNHIVQVTKDIQDNINTEMNDLRRVIATEIQFRDHQFQISLCTQNLEIFLDNVKSQILNMEIQLNSVIRHQFNPSVLSPQNLYKLLQSISESLPETLRLPYDIDSHLFSYYQNLPVSAVPMENGFFVMLAIPIINLQSKYEIYEILNIPVPYPETNLTAKIAIDQKYMAISNDRTTVSFLQQSEFQQCLPSNTMFCSLMLPLYPITMFKESCELYLFLNREFDDNMCDIILFPTTNQLPKLYHIQEGQWVITMHASITFHVNCPDGSTWSIKTKPPLAVIRLQNGCSASSGDLIVPPYYYKKSVFQVIEPTFKIPSNMSLWSYHAHTINQALVEIPHKLPKIGDSSQTMAELVTKLRHHLDSARSLQRTAKHSGYAWYVYFCIVVSLIIFLIILVTIIYCKCKHSVMKRQTKHIAKKLTAHYNVANSCVSLAAIATNKDPGVSSVNAETMHSTTHQLDVQSDSETVTVDKSVKEPQMAAEPVKLY
jgi:hypothetical protein